MASAPYPTSFAELLAPVTVEQFRRDYLDRAPLHVPGSADKFAHVMSWERLNQLLEMTEIWSSQSLQLALDRRMVPAAEYCRRGHNREGRLVLRPDPAKLRHLLRCGATLVLNDIDTLGPGLRAVADLLERALGARIQINLYFSWQERQGFPAHCDGHDVFALHIAGEKRWTIYRGRADQPIAHPAFKTLGQAHHDRVKGEVLMTADLKPGDLLYLPRGQYHDALATGDWAIHLAIGATEPIGLDVLTLLFDDSVTGESSFRRRLPVVDDVAAVGAHLDRLGARARGRLVDPQFQAKLEALRASLRYRRGGFPTGPGLRAAPAPLGLAFSQVDPQVLSVDSTVK